MSVSIDGPNSSISAPGTVTAGRFVGPFRETPSLVAGLPTSALGPPTSGAFLVGDIWIDGLIAKFRCTVAGTPGTWVQIEPAYVASFPGSPLTNYLVAWESEGWRQYFYNGSIWVPVFTGAKIYRALMSQAGSGAPTAVVLHNTIGSIVWTRDSDGAYKGTLAGAFALTKTWYMAASPPRGLFNDDLLFYRQDDDIMALDTLASGLPDDDILDSTPIEIAVYP